MNRAGKPPGKDTRNSAVDALRGEINQLQHELRRVQEGLERNATRALQERARHLRDNIALCERQLAAELRNRARPGGG